MLSIAIFYLFTLFTFKMMNELLNDGKTNVWSGLNAHWATKTCIPLYSVRILTEYKDIFNFLFFLCILCSIILIL